MAVLGMGFMAEPGLGLSGFAYGVGVVLVGGVVYPVGRAEYEFVVFAD